jgi:hypothetical protein
VARFLLSGEAVPHPPRPPTVIVLARPGPAGDDLFAELSRRADLTLLRAATAAAATVAIRELPVALVVACPGTAPHEIDAVLSYRDAVRPGTPVLAVRGRQEAAPDGWEGRGVAVLRMPLLADVLSRSVDVVLGMKVGT